MAENKIEQLLRRSSFNDLELDLIDNPREIVASIVSDQPDSTVGDMTNVLALAIQRMEEALGPVRDLHSQLSVVDPEVSAFDHLSSDIEKMISEDEMPCRSLLYWLLEPALKLSKNGDAEVVSRYVKALKLAEPVYGDKNNFDPDDGSMSQQVATYCDLLIAYVEGKTSKPPSLSEFSAHAASGIQ